MAAPKESEVELFPPLGERAIECLGRDVGVEQKLPRRFSCQKRKTVIKLNDK